MALPEGYQSLFLEDALYSLQDAMILSPWLSGGELLDLKLEENRENIFNSMSHSNQVQVSNSGIYGPVSQPMLRDDILHSCRITPGTDWDVLYAGLYNKNTHATQRQSAGMMVKFSQTAEIIQRNRERKQTVKKTRCHSKAEVQFYKQGRWTQDSAATVHHLHAMQARADSRPCSLLARVTSASRTSPAPLRNRLLHPLSPRTPRGRYLKADLDDIQGADEDPGDQAGR